VLIPLAHLGAIFARGFCNPASCARRPAVGVLGLPRALPGLPIRHRLAGCGGMGQRLAALAAGLVYEHIQKQNQSTRVLKHRKDT
jgi:hypothetical protein